MTTFSEMIPKSGGLSFVVGLDNAGDPVLFDFDSSTHLLIAGSTGTGKSVVVENILLNLLSHNNSDQLKMILCDTKMVELVAYNGIPHLMTPVCTTHDKILGVLAFACFEVSKRLFSFSSAGQKTLAKYNDYMWENFLSDTGLPHLIVVVDDLSDVIASSPEAIQYIRKILQNGRAVGVHLIAVTQTPMWKSTKGISLMIQSKIVLSFSSKAEESALIGTKKDFSINEIGLGIFSSRGVPQKVKILPRSDSDRVSIIQSVKKLNQTNCDETAEELISRYTQPLSKSEPIQDCFIDIDKDIFAEAVDVVMETGQASISMLQRRLNIGYSKAARLIDRMEERGYIGPFEGSNPRTLLLTKSQWKSIRSDNEFAGLSSSKE